MPKSLSLCSFYVMYRSWAVEKDEEVDDKHPSASSSQSAAMSVIKSRGSTIRREDQQSYDSAVGKESTVLILI